MDLLNISSRQATRSLPYSKILLIFGVLCIAFSSILFQRFTVKRQNTISDSMQALRLTWSTRIDTAGPAAAYKEFKKLPLHGGEQHAAYHIFGILLYDKFGLSGLGYCDDSGEDGCFHGFLGEALYRKGIQSIESVRNACEHAGQTRLVCFHALGHGIFSKFNDEKINTALSYCKAFDIKDREKCEEGIFMEYTDRTVTDPTIALGEQKQFDPTQPYLPCTHVDRPFQPVCYYYIGSWLFRMTHESPEKTGVLCQKISETDLRQRCFTGLGIRIAQKSNNDRNEALFLCGKVPTEEGKMICRKLSNIQ